MFVRDRLYLNSMIPRILIFLSLLLPFQIQAQTFQINATNAEPCVGETITLSHENDLPSDWTIPANAFEVVGGTSGTSSVQIVCNDAGVYQISANDGTDQGSITISVSTVNANFEVLTGSIDRNKINVVSAMQPAPYNLPYSFDWDFDDGTTFSESITESAEDDVYRSIQPHTYDLSSGDSIFNISLNVTNGKGCTDSYDTTVTINSAIKVPNVFTPNADGKNDFFIITSADGTELSITIFSRWGNIVYESDQPSTIIEWDGRLKDNSFVSTGVYYYVLVPENNPAMDKKMGFFHVFTNKNR
jgi:gliding motility-associated-like protein